ncbi:AimR family lysis-lysogeny pheromone receptor [Alkalihalobacillus macyae]|uniref:AimR family lysis-lysogeny pheromone receptor n=1 Tax=Guptibacillus hwajinpoensis TaxID=208199 RepID=UPI00273AB29A|nr:AimR family lysis-lysogeny pheromone receptor [Alkalihalobacillus macyae]MDP4550855.1 AimR family lysis-lysogeny pheromone receptor [Alkalihalobacillus macyae]
MITNKRESIRGMIENQMVIADVSASQLAKAVEVSEPTISRFFKGTEVGFATLARMAAFLFPENYTEVLAGWATQVESALNQRCAMEWASVNSKTDLLRSLIDENIEGYRRENVQFAKVYSEFLRYTVREITAEELSERIKCKGFVNGSELSTLVKIIEVYVLFKAGKHSLMFEVGKSIESEVRAMKNNFLRDSFLVRLAEIYSYGYLYKGDVKKARYYSRIVKAATFAPRLAAQAYFVSGISYLHEDDDRTISDLQACYDRAKEAGASEKYLRQMKENIDFALVHFDRDCQPVSPTELAYQAAKRGDVATAEKYVSESTNKPMAAYCVALAKEDVDLMWSAYGSFIESGDLHFAVLPRKELARYGERESAINCYLRMA